ncbi:MAG TPA: hypothetical protein VJP79_08205 [Nitrososphaera sp.]|nr:hypothetical protein [Nitrososphaera sp.]
MRCSELQDTWMMADMATATTELVLEQDDLEEGTTYRDMACPECDCMLEMSYSDEGRQRFYCDNCDSFVANDDSLMPHVVSDC